eukprot:1578754-Pyramimonas_sp.AAC.1
MSILIRHARPPSRLSRRGLARACDAAAEGSVGAVGAVPSVLLSCSAAAWTTTARLSSNSR